MAEPRVASNTSIRAVRSNYQPAGSGCGGSSPSGIVSSTNCRACMINGCRYDPLTPVHAPRPDLLRTDKRPPRALLLVEGPPHGESQHGSIAPASLTMCASCYVTCAGLLTSPRRRVRTTGAGQCDRNVGIRCAIFRVHLALVIAHARSLGPVCTIQWNAWQLNATVVRSRNIYWPVTPVDICNSVRYSPLRNVRVYRDVASVSSRRNLEARRGWRPSVRTA